MKNVLTDKVRVALSWILRQPLAVRVRQRHPRLVSFVAARFDPNFFVGLPLTLMLLAGAVNVTLLSHLTESVVESEWVVTVDKMFTAMLFNMRSVWLSQVLFALTILGDQLAVFIIGGVVTAVFLLRRKWVALIAFWLAMAGVGLSVRFGKTIVSRERPADVAYYMVEHFSFPSGHATTVLAMFGMIAYFLYRHFQEPWEKKLVLWLAAILIVVVGFSRIYLGVHYLSDVLAGFLLGGLWLLVGISLVEVMMYRKRKYDKLHSR